MLDVKFLEEINKSVNTIVGEMDNYAKKIELLKDAEELYKTF